MNEATKPACQKCGKPMEPRETVSYGTFCEDCFAEQRHLFGERGFWTDKSAARRKGRMGRTNEHSWDR
jgi:hypothetical protein